MRTRTAVIPFVALLLVATPALADPIAHHSSGKVGTALKHSDLSEDLMLDALAAANLNRPRLLVLWSVLNGDESLPGVDLPPFGRERQRLPAARR